MSTTSLKDYTMRTRHMVEIHTGIVWTAGLYLDGRKIGTIENRGDGGADFVFITDKGERAQWRDFVAQQHEGDEEKATEWLMFQEYSLTS